MLEDRELQSIACSLSYMRVGDTYVIRTGLFTFIYILFIELAIVTAVTIALFLALVVTIRKLDNEKNTSLLDPLEMYS